MENLLKNLEILREKVLSTSQILDIDRKKERVAENKIEMSKPDFWSNQERAVGLGRETEELESEVLRWESFLIKVRDLEELVAVAEKEGDQSVTEYADSEYEKLLKEYGEMEFFVLFSGKHDDRNAVISIHSGSGGVDAQDWAEMLERMYLRFAERRGWKAEIIDRTPGNEAGIKSSHIRIIGRWVYGYLRGEGGTHRLVRISPFDAEAMRHTSFALVEVVPELPEAEEIELKDEDLKIDTYRASGAGGQKVNKTESAIRVTHSPSGIVVTCQNERSQHQNKETALKILKSKLYRIQEEEREKEEAKLKGANVKAEWGNQVRSYVLQPYKMVKDHRTGCETAQVDMVLEGELESFVEAYLRQNKKD